MPGSSPWGQEELVLACCFCAMTAPAWSCKILAHMHPFSIFGASRDRSVSQAPPMTEKCKICCTHQMGSYRALIRFATRHTSKPGTFIYWWSEDVSWFKSVLLLTQVPGSVGSNGSNPYKSGNRQYALYVWWKPPKNPLQVGMSKSGVNLSLKKIFKNVPPHICSIFASIGTDKHRWTPTDRCWQPRAHLIDRLSRKNPSGLEPIWRVSNTTYLIPPSKVQIPCCSFDSDPHTNVSLTFKHQLWKFSKLSSSLLWPVSRQPPLSRLALLRANVLLNV
jgi:hypothetical protein